MNPEDVRARRPARASEQQMQVTPARVGALVSLVAVLVIVMVIILSATHAGGSHLTASTAAQSGQTGTGQGSSSPRPSQPRTASVPILAYHVINSPPPSSSVSRSLYVPAAEFAAQMQALKAGGWHPITLDQLQQYWAHGTSLAVGKPLVLTFDDGYASHYTNALPVLKALSWVGVEDLQINGLPPSEGGLADTQVRGLTAAGWELDLEGSGQAGLTSLGSSQLLTELQSERQTLQSTYGVPVNWFTYPGGSYNPTLTAAVRQAGFIGGMTVVSGWANPKGDRFRLPRLQVLGGTTPAQLLSQIAAAQANTSIPTSAGSG